jgi:hypothetical protein
VIVLDLGVQDGVEREREQGKLRQGKHENSGALVKVYPVYHCLAVICHCLAATVKVIQSSEMPIVSRGSKAQIPVLFHKQAFNCSKSDDWGELRWTRARVPVDRISQRSRGVARELGEPA